MRIFRNHWVTGLTTASALLWSGGCGSAGTAGERQVPILLAGTGAAGISGQQPSSALPTTPATGTGAAGISSTIAALAGTGASVGVVAATGFCDVQPILKDKCQLCHAAAPLFGAPMALVTYADLLAPSKTDASKPVYKRVAERIHNMQMPMPPSGQPTLDANAIGKLDSWIAANAPMGAVTTCMQPAMQTPTTGSDTPGTAVPGRAITSGDVWPEDCGEHYKFLATDPSGGKYKIGAGQQFYANIMIPAPWGAGMVQALRFKPLTDNLKVLHHYILYSSDQSFIDGWAPGQSGITMPPTVGMQMPAGTYRLEVHYNNATGTQQELDGSGIEFCAAKTPRPNMAAVHELGNMAINIPAHGMQVLPSTCKPTVANGPVHLMEINPHMHKTGIHATSILTRANGDKVTIHDAAFSFDSQTKYILPEDGSAADILLNKGDSITSTCTFKNDTNAAIRFGQNTQDEMCFFYVIAWPMGQLVNGSRGPEGDPNACM
jgi:hypothetical protein